EPVVAIAAETPEIAAGAADLVEVEYEELPGVYDPLAALDPSAPHVHDGGNLLRSWHLRSGDVARGLREAAVVVEHTYRTPFVDHVYLETETGLGWIDAEGVLVLRVSTQVLEHYRDVAVPRAARQGRCDHCLYEQPRGERLPVLRLDPDLSRVRRPDGRARGDARHGPARAAREELPPQGRRARHRSGARDRATALRDDEARVGGA